VTIRTMTLGRIFLLCALVLLPACAEGEEPSRSAPDAVAARAAAEEAAEAVAELEERLAGLEEEVSKASETAEDTRSDLRAKIDAIRERIWGSIADLRSSLDALTGDTETAKAEAQEALGNVSAALRQLNVLEDRFDYHVNKQHGGG
jgi:predicted  nucleic acid-binding Zn-ribbon protein